MGMGPSVQRLTVSFNAQGAGLVKCEQCGKARTISASHLYQQEKILNRANVRVRCACGHSFYVEFDRRRSQRIKLHVPGKLLQFPPGCRYYDIMVTSLSMHGVGFMMQTNTTISAGATFEILFKLDDKQQSVIYKTICIKHRHDRSLGAAFCEDSDHQQTLCVQSLSSATIAADESSGLFKISAASIV
jgi:hypothetical protein